MSEDVEADLEDLDSFATSGKKYHDEISDATDEVETYRRRTIELLAFSPEVDGIAETHLALAQIFLNNQFVAAVSAAYEMHARSLDQASVEGSIVTVDSAATQEALTVAGFGSSHQGLDDAAVFRLAAEVAERQELEDQTDSFTALAEEADRKLALLSEGLDERTATAIADGQPELTKFVLAGDLTSGEAYRLRTSGRRLIAMVADGDLTTSQAVRIDRETNLAEGVEAGTLDAGFALAFISGEHGSAVEDAVEHGDHPRALHLTLDPEQRAAFALSQHFEETFADATIEDLNRELMLELASEQNMRSVRARLTENGLSGRALSDAVDDVEAALKFYGDPANEEALGRLDGANDRDGDVDGKLTLEDAAVRAVELTGSERSGPEGAVREQALTEWVHSSHTHHNEVGTLLEGEHHAITDLNSDDRVLIARAYIRRVGSKNQSLLASKRQLALALTDYRHSDEVKLDIAKGYALEAVETEAVDDDAFDWAQTLASHSLAQSNIVDDGSVFDSLEPEEALGLATALTHGDNTRSANEDYQFRGPTTKALQSIADERHGAELTENESLFVYELFNSAPDTSGYRFRSALAETLAIGTAPNDAAGQTEHATRLEDLFNDRSIWASLAVGEGSANLQERQLLQHYLTSGVPDRSSGDAGELKFWHRDDFKDSTAARDVTLEMALAAGYTHDEFAPILDEIIDTEDGRGLLGFGPKNTELLRPTIIHTIADGRLATADFDSEGDPLANQKVNQIYAQNLLLVSDPGSEQAALDRVYELAEADTYVEQYGLGSDRNDMQRLQLLNLAVANEWTVADLDDHDFFDNTKVSAAYANQFLTAMRHPDLATMFDNLDPEADDYEKTMVTYPGFTMDPGDLEERAKELRARRLHDTEVDQVPFIWTTPEGDRIPMVLLKYTARDESTMYMDGHGYKHASIDEWLSQTQLPGKVTYLSSATGDDFAVPADNGARWRTDVTEAHPDTFMEKYGGYVVTSVAVVGSAIVIVFSAGTATPLVATGWGMIGLAAGYEAYSAGSELYQHLDAGGDWGDPRARDAYISLGLSAAELAPGAGRTFKHAARSRLLTAADDAARLSKSGKAGVSELDDAASRFKRWNAVRTGVGRAVTVADTGMVGAEIYRIVETDAPVEQKLKALALIGTPSSTLLAARGLRKRQLADSTLGQNSWAQTLIEWTPDERIKSGTGPTEADFLNLLSLSARSDKVTPEKWEQYGRKFKYINKDVNDHAQFNLIDIVNAELMLDLERLPPLSPLSNYAPTHSVSQHHPLDRRLGLRDGPRTWGIADHNGQTVAFSSGRNGISNHLTTEILDLYKPFKGRKHGPPPEELATLRSHRLSNGMPVPEGIVERIEQGRPVGPREIAYAHTEGQAIEYMRQHDLKTLTLKINHRGGPCNYACQDGPRYSGQLAEMLPEGSKLKVMWVDRDSKIVTDVFDSKKSRYSG